MRLSDKSIDQVFKQVPARMDQTQILYFLKSHSLTNKHVLAIKAFDDFTDAMLSYWLNVSEKTVRNYVLPATTFKENTQEHIVSLLSLFKHGKNVFASKSKFADWLDKENFFFDGDKPSTYLNTISGIKFVDDRLTAMEFGDNV